MKYAFALWPPEAEQVRPDTYAVPTIELYARSDAEACAAAQRVELPEGKRIWTWYALPDESCTMCGGPFHPATGHWESPARHWCGPCTREMLALLKSFLPRRWGRLRFYDHATVPSGDTSAADLAS